MKIKVKYVEPKNYFSKEALKVFNDGRTTIKGMRTVFCKDKYLIIDGSNTLNLACIELTHDALYSSSGDFKYRYYISLHSENDKFFQVFIKKNEYNKLFKIKEDEFFPIVADIINKDKRGKNNSHIRIVNIIP